MKTTHPSTIPALAIGLLISASSAALADGGVVKPPSADMVTVEGGTLEMSMGKETVPTFDISRYEVTWGQWQAVRDRAVRNGYDLANVGRAHGGDARHPVTHVSWYDALKWCNAASESAGLTPVYTVNGQVYRTGESVPDWNQKANGYRLPSEVESEFAFRGGTRSQGYTYSGSNTLAEVGWYRENARDSTRPVGQKKANELGLYDMSGNVWGFCWEEDGRGRRFRGGCFYNPAHECIASLRERRAPFLRVIDTGFRVARNSEK